MLSDFVAAWPVGDQLDACTALDDIHDLYDTHLQYDDDENNLYTMVQSSIKWAEQMSESGGQTTVILFASTQNKTEIQVAANYVARNRKLENFLVVAMRGADFSSFPASRIYDVYDLTSAPSCLAYTVQSAACGNFEAVCSTTRATSSTPIASVSARTASTSQKPTNPTHTPSSTQKPTSSPRAWNSGNNPQCACQFNQSWNDVIFLFDGSESSSKPGLEEMWANVQTWLPYFNVQRAGYTTSVHYMEVGVCVYGNTNHVLGALGDWDQTDVDNTEMLPYYGDERSNIEAALRAAIDQFNGPNARKNSKKVIVLYATSYNDDDSSNAQQMARTFIEDGGIIMVYNYIENHGEASPQLMELASDGYFFSSLNTTILDLQVAQCDGQGPFFSKSSVIHQTTIEATSFYSFYNDRGLRANCHCPRTYSSFTNSQRRCPTGGCYTFTETQSNYRLAMNKCQMFQNSILAVDESQEKTSFFRSQFLTTGDFWIGLAFNATTSRWEWSGTGQPLNQTYTPWRTGIVPDGRNSLTNVFMSSTNEWVTTDPRNGYLYSCEAIPSRHPDMVCHLKYNAYFCLHWSIDVIGGIAVLFWLTLLVGTLFFGWFGFNSIRFKKQTKRDEQIVGEKQNISTGKASSGSG